MHDNIIKSSKERMVAIMLAIAWVFMGIAIIASGILLDDLAKEMEYNNKNIETIKDNVIYIGGSHELRRNTYREDRILRRCS
jgi:hypothetical protein